MSINLCFRVNNSILVHIQPKMSEDKLQHTLLTFHGYKSHRNLISYEESMVVTRWEEK